MKKIKGRKAREADYIFWFRKPFWGPFESALLLGGYEPEPVEFGSLDYSFIVDDVGNIFHEIIMDFQRQDLPSMLPPKERIDWARQKGMELPNVLLTYLDKVKNET